MTLELAADAGSDGLTGPAREFFHAWRRADMARITQLLAPNCEWYRDGEPIAVTDSVVFGRPGASAPDITPQMINVDDHGASALLIDATAGPYTRRPVGFINLKFDADGIAKVSEARLPAGRDAAEVAPRPSVGAAVAGAGAHLVAVVLYCFFDELLFSIPVIAVAAIWGPWQAFLLLTPLYFAFAVAVGVVISRVREQRGASRGSALQRWLDTKTARQGTDWERRALLGFGFLGAGVVTIVLGPFLTPWLAHRLGLDGRYGTLVAGSVFWSICQVGTYSGLIALIL